MEVALKLGRNHWHQTQGDGGNATLLLLKHMKVSAPILNKDLLFSKNILFEYIFKRNNSTFETIHSLKHSTLFEGVIEVPPMCPAQWSDPLHI